MKKEKYMKKSLGIYQNFLQETGAISYRGVGKLIFITATLETFSYLHTLKLYKEDIDRLGRDLYFPQDCAIKLRRHLTISIKTFRKS